MKQLFKINDSNLNKIIRKAINEAFEDDYANARNNYKRGLWGFEMKNKEGDCES